MPYFSYSQPSPASTYSFPTTEGQSIRVSIPTALNLQSHLLVLEVDDSSSFRHARLSGNVSYVPGMLSINFTGAEVDEMKNCFYRVRAVREGVSYVLVEGAIDYNPYEGLDSGGVLNGSGQIKEALLPPLTVALESVFLRKDEYEDRVIDPVVLEQAVDSRLKAHIQSVTPHPAYDIDLQDLAGLFENRLF